RFDLLQRVSSRLARHRHVDLVGAFEGADDVVGGMHRARQVNAREVSRVALRLIDLARLLGAARPHGDLCTAVGKNLAERGAPATRSENCDPGAHMRPVSLWPCLVGSQRSSGGVSPRSSPSRREISPKRRSVASFSTPCSCSRPTKSLMSRGSPTRTLTRRRGRKSDSLP